MAFSQLNAMTVPVGSNPGAATATDTGLLMPKLQYRFRIVFNSFGADIEGRKEITKHITDVTRPNVSFDQITVDAYNSRLYLAGKHNWEPITINFRDDVENNVTKMISEQLTKQFDFFEQSSAASGADYKFQMDIQTLDGANNGSFKTTSTGATGPSLLDNYKLIGCYIESANFNSLNYAESAPQTISITVRYDNIIIDKHLSTNTLTGTIGRTVATAITGIAADAEAGDAGGAEETG